MLRNESLINDQSTKSIRKGKLDSSKVSLSCIYNLLSKGWVVIIAKSISEKGFKLC